MSEQSRQQSGGAVVGPWSPGSPSSPQRGARRTVASYADYRDAERAVDRLSDLNFPVERVAIVGQDLQTVEQVTGRMNYAHAAWKGALSGLVPGLLIGWIFGIFNWVAPLITALLLAIYGAIIGLVVGAIIGVIIYAMQRGRRDFASVVVTQPQRFEVVVDDEVADEAARLLESRT
jgi:heat induced stress protein YflT